jgi:hypothetical protein
LDSCNWLQMDRLGPMWTGPSVQVKLTATGWGRSQSSLSEIGSGVMEHPLLLAHCVHLSMFHSMALSIPVPDALVCAIGLMLPCLLYD